MTTMPQTPNTFADEPLDRLTNLAGRASADIRPTLLRALTALYLEKPYHTTDEQNQYVELALGLIAAVDRQTRAAIAERLRHYPAAPSVVLDKIAELDAARDAPPESRTAASSRPSAAEDDLVELFFTACAEERRLILLNLDVAMRTPPRPLSGRADAVSGLEKAAIERDTNDFIRLLTRILGVSRSLAERIVNDRSGEPFVVVAKALGLSGATLQGLLSALPSDTAQPDARMASLMQLSEDLSAHAANHMIWIWQQSSKRGSLPYESLHWDDEHRDARSLSSPTKYNVAREHNSQSGRTKTGTR